MEERVNYLWWGGCYKYGAPTELGGKSGKWKAEVEKIEPAQVRRMIAVLDEKCRDVEF
jgi:hypothetical protein